MKKGAGYRHSQEQTFAVRSYQQPPPFQTLEHRVTVLEQEHIHIAHIQGRHQQEIERCKAYKDEVQGIVARLGWAIAILALAAAIWMLHSLSQKSPEWMPPMAPPGFDSN